MLVSLIAHASIAPVLAIALTVTSKVSSWKAELLALVVLGAVRGGAINVVIGILDLEQRVPSLYKVFNSAISLPVWFIGLAVFVESRRQFQREYEALFLRAVRKEQATGGQQSLLVGELRTGEQIAHLQSLAASLASDIKRALDLPTAQLNFAQQAGKIQDLINKKLRPASAQLWNNSTLSTPKLSFSALLRISLLEQKLKVVLVTLLAGPYLFIGLNGSQGWKFATVETLFATSANIAIFFACEALFKIGIINRRSTNMAIIGLSFLLQLLAILFVIPGTLFWTDSVLTLFLYQFFLTVNYSVTLLGFNMYKLLGQQRSAVLKHFEYILHSKEMLPISSSDLSAVRNIDLARYLHGEFQAGLIATSLLLERASQRGDTDLARHALRSAVDILTQDHVQLSQSRVSFPQERLEKISSGWRGIAQVRIDLGWIDDLEISAQNDVIALIDEGVSNAIRHAKASLISVTGSWVDGYVNLEIHSDGAGMTQNAPGLGTKLFAELATSWDYSRNGEQNILRFTIRTEG
jgi:signal transduction histidine kinase